MSQSTQDTITQSKQQPEAEPDHEQYVSRLRQHGHSREGRSVHSIAATEAEAEAHADAGEGAGVQDAEDCQECMYAPYSNLLWCDTAITNLYFSVSQQLCTDIRGKHSSGTKSWAARSYHLTPPTHCAPA